MDYAIGSEKWPGLAKVMEESAELTKVLADIISIDGEDDHPSGAYMPDVLIEELGDLLAAINFFVEANGIDEHRIGEREIYKVRTYWAWHEATLEQIKTRQKAVIDEAKRQVREDGSFEDWKWPY